MMDMNFHWNRKGGLLVAFAIAGAVPALAATCESLASLALPNTRITLAQTVAAGSFMAPGAANPLQPARRSRRIVAPVEVSRYFREASKIPASMSGISKIARFSIFSTAARYSSSDARSFATASRMPRKFLSTMPTPRSITQSAL